MLGLGDQTKKQVLKDLDYTDNALEIDLILRLHRIELGIVLPVKHDLVHFGGPPQLLQVVSKHLVEVLFHGLATFISLVDDTAASLDDEGVWIELDWFEQLVVEV